MLPKCTPISSVLFFVFGAGVSEVWRPITSTLAVSVSSGASHKQAVCIHLWALPSTPDGRCPGSDVPLDAEHFGVRRTRYPNRDGLLKSPKLFSTIIDHQQDQVQDGQQSHYFSAGKVAKSGGGVTKKTKDVWGRLGLAGLGTTIVREVLCKRTTLTPLHPEPLSPS